MSSPPEVDQGGAGEPNDSLASNDDAPTRRGKRDQVTRPQSYSLSNSNNTLLALPFVLFYLFLQAMYRVASDFVGDPAAMVRDFVASGRETDTILKEVPIEQQKQQQQLHHVHEEQVHQRQKLNDLQIRVQRMEERRAAREAAAADNNAIPDLKIGGKDMKSE